MDESTHNAHRRSTDDPNIITEHERSDDSAFSAVRRVLSLPLGQISAIVTFLLALLGVWLTHDRAIAAVQTTIANNRERVVKLEARDEERSKADVIFAATLARIETKLDNLKDRLDRGDDAARDTNQRSAK